MAVNDVRELVIRGHENNVGTSIVNVFHFRSIDPLWSSSNLINEFVSGVLTEFRATATSTYVCDKITCNTLIPFQTDWAELPINLTGTHGSGNVLAPCIACVISWKTGFAGRRKRGRTYLSGQLGIEAASGRWVSSYLNTAATPFANKMLAVFGPAGTSTHARFGVWSRVNAGPPPTFNFAGFTDVTYAQVRSEIATLGSRRVHPAP